MSTSHDRQQLANLTREQRMALFEQIRKQKKEQPPDPTIRRQSRAMQSYPLSFAQQRLWFLDQFEPGTPLYNVPLALRVRGPLNHEVLRRVLESLLARHETLRTTFVSSDGDPQQVIAEPGRVPLPLIDLRSLPETLQLTHARELVAVEEQQPFDLRNGPILRTRLLQLTGEEHILAITMHHIASDAWSRGIFMRELQTLYNAYLQNQPSPLPELPIRYVDFALWQREWLQGETLEELLTYWKQQLQDLPTLQLPTDYPRPALHTIRGAICFREIPPTLLTRLQMLGRHQHDSLFMLLLSAFAILLSRYTGSKDIAIGSAIANRNRTEIEGLIGFFVNTLVMRIDLSGDPNFRKLVERVREVCLDAYAHQDLPFERLVEELRPERDLSIANPLIQVTMALQNVPKAPLEIPGLAFEPLIVETQTAKFDISLFVLGNEQQSFLEIEYNTDLFAEETIKRMLGHLLMILEAVADNPDQPISAIPLLTPAERQQILVAWNATDEQYDQEPFVHQMFETWAALIPDAIAAITEDEQLTYQELNVYANQLAHYLRKAGVKPESLVGICLKRSFNLLTCLLAVLKAGGAYVLLDPTYPMERLALMIEDASITLLVTTQTQGAPLAGPETQMLYLENEWEYISREDTANPTGEIDTENLAYVIYTSGSTGRPKGVQIAHQGLRNLICWHRQTFALKPHDRASHFASLSFDGALWEIWPSLATGATLCLIDDEIRHDPQLIREWMIKQQITLGYLPTPLAESVLDEAWPENLAMHTLTTGGDALHYAPPEQCPFALVNTYGPAENSVVTTFGVVPSAPQTYGLPSIGRPMSNVQVYVLDSQMQPVPIGVTGELFIGGTGLARGYRHHPDLTAERFLPNPFVGGRFPSSWQPGSRLYRTGDLARYRSNGELDFLGRNDHQVKIRGCRVELSEVEAALRQHPAIAEAIVVARGTALITPGQPDTSSSEKSLIAYIVRRKPRQEDEQEMPAVRFAEQVAHWQQIFDLSYRDAKQPDDPTFNIAGWNSSYTGQPLTEEEMRQWVEQTVERIRFFRPERVLEIGCGTGLLLTRIAPLCQEYWGTDLSPVAIQALQGLLIEQALSNVRLFQRSADDFSAPLAEQQGSFDAIILNSVIQYFPSVEYLVHVLEQAVQLLTPGGFLFIGDVRNLTLLETYHTSVQLRQAIPSLFTRQLQTLIQKRLTSENELLLDPAFFSALQWHLPAISQVELQLKRGRVHNELTRFRYDVWLHKERTSTTLDAYIELDWQKEQLTLPTLCSMLQQQRPDVLRITHVPNARLQTDMQALALLRDKIPPEKVELLWEALRADNQTRAVDPEDFWSLANTLPYRVAVTWSDAAAPACYDVLLMAHSLGERHQLLLSIDGPTSTRQSRAPEQRISWRTYANDPAQAATRNMLIGEIYDYMKQKLPDYMVPSLILELKALPLSPNGKVDYQALPTPDGSRPALKSAFVAPRTASEKILAEIWSQVLGFAQIGIHDNFFELGGDSLMTIRVVTRASRAGLGITVKQIFQHQTIAELAAASNSLAILAEQGLVTGPVPIMPAQAVNLAPGRGDLSCQSMAYILEAAEALNPLLVEKVVRHLLMYHDALRIQAHQTDHGWELFNEGFDDSERLPFWRADFSFLSEIEQVSAVTALAKQMVMHFDLSRGPLLRVALCYLGSNRPTPLIIVGHSLVVDVQSWQILLEDVKIAYQQLRDTGTISFPPKTTSCKQWAERLQAYAQSEQLQTELPYWLTHKHVPPLLMDYPGGANNGASTLIMFGLFEVEETETLRWLVSKRKDLQMDAILLTAVAQTLTRWSKQQTLQVMIEGYGREPDFEDIDLSRTLGLLPLNFPLQFHLAETMTAGETLRAVGDQLRGVPHHGIGYSVLRHMSKDVSITSAMATLPQPEIYFNYLGSMLRPEVDDFKVDGPYNGRVYTIDRVERQLASFLVIFWIANGHLQMSWQFSTNQYRTETIKQLVIATRENVRAMISYLQAEE